MKYALNVEGETNRVLSACTVNMFTPPTYPQVVSLPDGDLYDYRYEDGEFIYDPLPQDINYSGEIEELKGKLCATDYAVIKIAEGAATKEDYAPLIKNRQLWRARINELEELSNEKPESRSYI